MLCYVKKKSPVHLLDARAKLALLAAYMVAQIAAPLAYSPLFFALTLALFALARIDFFEAVQSRRVLLLIPLIPSLLRLLFEKGSVEIAGMLLPAGVANGSLNFIFLCSLVYAPLLFALTTAPSQIGGALRFYGMPRRWAFIFSVAFVSVHYIQKKAERTIAAQRARGCRRNALAIMLPVLHSCFRRARTLSYSMASRGFDPDST